jgi:hypothetical protein
LKKEFYRKNRVLNKEEKEDLVLGLMMQKTDYNDTIDTNEFVRQQQDNDRVLTYLKYMLET